MNFIVALRLVLHQPQAHQVIYSLLSTCKYVQETKAIERVQKECSFVVEYQFFGLSQTDSIKFQNAINACTQEWKDTSKVATDINRDTVLIREHVKKE